ncbi:MAG TPA: hypothetical protein VFW73_04065, partial [Lacipirellulaceae bacterium]|nr:hypothetical protein [Lacipirellulaceae bacterium]
MTYRTSMLAALFVSFVPLVAPAEIIIDDFDDPAEIMLPAMENQAVTTTGVGMLNAERWIEVGALDTDPIGLVDVGITKPSHL